MNWTRSGSADVANHQALFRSDLLHTGNSDIPNSIRIDVSDNGNVLTVNDVVLADVPLSDLRPDAGWVRFCTGLFVDEHPYTVRFLTLTGGID